MVLLLRCPQIFADLLRRLYQLAEILADPLRRPQPPPLT
jgi:hypothetical protein